jgi:hypothetical protein
MRKRPFLVRTVTEGWEIRRQGDAQPISTHDARCDAVQKALALAAHDQVRVVISDVSPAIDLRLPGHSAA